MFNIQNGIRSMTEFKQNSSAILKYIKKTHSPAILTVNGKAEAVLLDAESYQKMVDQIEMMESAKQIEAALVEMENSRDKCIPAKKAFEQIRQKITKK